MPEQPIAPAQNSIYSFMKDNELTSKSEADFNTEYADSGKARELYGFFTENELTSKDFDSFYKDNFSSVQPAAEASQPLTYMQKELRGKGLIQDETIVRENVSTETPLSKIDQLKLDYLKKTRGEEYANQEQAKMQSPKIPIPGWDEKSPLDKFTTGVKSGWEGTKGGLKYTGAVMLEGLDKMDGEEDWQYDNRLFESAKENFKAAPRGEGIWYQLGSFTPQMIGIAAATISAPITGGTSLSAAPAIIGGANIATLVASASGNAMHEYDQYNEQEGKEGSDIARIGVGIGSGAAEYLAERIGLDRYMPKGSMSKAFTKFLSTSGQDIAEEIGKKALSKNPSVKGFLKKTAVNMLEEGSEESLTEAGNILIETLYKDDKDEAGLSEIVSRLSDAFGGGVLMAGAISPISYGSSVAYERKMNQQPGSQQPSEPVSSDITPQLTVNPRQTKEAELRQYAEGMAHTETGMLTMVQKITPGQEENIPMFVVQSAEDGSMLLADDQGNKEWATQKDIAGQPEQTTIDDFVAGQMGSYDQTEQQKELLKKNQIRIDGKQFILTGDKAKDGYVAINPEDGSDTVIPFATVDNLNGANQQNPNIVKTVYGKTNVSGVKNEDGSLSVSEPASIDQANALKEQVEKETGGKATVQADLIPNEDATAPQAFQLTIIPKVNEPINDESITPAASQDNGLKAEVTDELFSQSPERKITTQQIGKDQIDFIEGEEFDEVVPTDKMPLEKALPILEKKFKDHPKVVVVAEKVQVEVSGKVIKGETKWDDDVIEPSTFKTVVKSIKIVPKEVIARQKKADTDILLDILDEFNATPQSREDKQKASEIEAIAKQLGYQTERTPMNEIRLFDNSGTISKPNVSKNNNTENVNIKNVSENSNQNTDNQSFESLFNSESSQNNQVQNEEPEKSTPIIESELTSNQGENTPQAQQGQGNKEGLEENVNIEARKKQLVQELDNFYEQNYVPLNEQFERELAELNKSQGTNYLNAEEILNGRNEYSDTERSPEAIEFANRQLQLYTDLNLKRKGLISEYNQLNKPQLTEQQRNERESIKSKLKEIWNKINKKVDLDEGFSVDFTPVLNVQNGSIASHGMGKSSFAASLNELFTLFDNGIDIFRGQGGGLETAPLAKQNGEAGAFGSTAGGTAYRDGSFILLSNTENGIISDINQITGILVNDGITNNNSEILDLLREAFPDLQIESFSNAATAVSNIQNSQNIDPSRENVIQPISTGQPATVSKTADPVAEQIAQQEINLNPTEAQKTAGNYKKGHVKIQGMDITIENPKGSFRKGVDEDGKAWETEMKSHYGYFKQTTGKDGDHIDVFIGENPDSQTIYVIDQVFDKGDKSGLFDESKVMLGYNSPKEAEDAYMANYDDSFNGLSDMTPVSVEEFKSWLYDGARQRKPFADYKDTPAPLIDETITLLSHENNTENKEVVNSENVNYISKSHEIPVSEDGLYQIYTAKAKNKDGGIDNFFVVPSVENKESRGFGDGMFKTLPEAIEQVRLNRIEEVELQKEKAEKEKQKEINVQIEADKQARKEANKGKSIIEVMNEAKNKKILDAKMNYNGEIKTRREHTEEIINNGGRTETAEVNKIKEPSKSEWNRMNERQQTESDRRIKEGGIKIEYRLYTNIGSFYDITKAEYDYANSLIAKKPLNEYLSDSKKAVQEKKSNTKNNNFVENQDNGSSNKSNNRKAGLDNHGTMGYKAISRMVDGQPEAVGIYRTVEASNTAGIASPILTAEELEELESRGINPNWDKPTFLKELKNQAQQNKVWLDPSFLDDKILQHDQKAEGTSENDVYLNVDGESLTKINNLSYVKSSDHGQNFNATIDRLDAHNSLFPDIAYKIKGFVDNKNGYPSLVLEQPFVKDVERNATKEEIEQYLISRGFKLDGVRNWSNGHEVWSDGKYELFDARPANVLKGNDGQLYFVDAFPHSVEYLQSEKKQSTPLPEEGEKKGKKKPLNDFLAEAKANIEEKKLTPEINAYIAPESFNETSFDEFNRALAKGEVGVEEFKKAFEALLLSKDAIISELNGMTKAELLKGMSGMGQYRYKNEKKDAVVKSIWSDHLMDFAFGSISYSFDGTSMDQIVAKKVANTTQKNIDDFVAETQKRKQEYIARVQEFKKALTNPETLPEFKIFIDKNGLDKLSPEQKAAYDNLVTDKVIVKRNEAIENKAIVGKVDLVGVEMDITETKHTKTGADLFVVKLSERISKEDYQDLNSKAKQLGGYYSSFRGTGAVPGFQFKTREQAQKFVDLKKEDASNLDLIEEKQDNKLQDRVSKLRENAQKIIDRVDSELSKDRLTNTAKRASQAASTEARLGKENQIAQTMMNIADAIEDGDVKLLDGIKAKTHIELLDGLINQAKYKEIGADSPTYSERMSREGEPATVKTVEYAQDSFYPNIYADHIKSLIDKVGDRSGVKLIATRWSKRLLSAKSQDYYKASSQSEVDDLTAMVNALRGNEKNYNRVAEEISDYNRLKSMGIENDSMLRAALREYVQYRGKSQEVDKVKKLERALVGRKGIGIDFFPTPKETAQLMVDEAGITEGMDVLEPSAGNGNIADAIKESGVQPDVIELSSALSEILEAKGYDVVASDFMEFSGKKYDRIVMNPPFQNGMDGDHVMHAYDLLKPGGKIVAIVGEGTFIRNDKKAVAFREWLDSIGGTEEKLDQGTFQDKTLLNTTGANARMVVIERGESEAMFSGKDVENSNSIGNAEEVQATINYLQSIDKSNRAIHYKTKAEIVEYLEENRHKFAQKTIDNVKETRFHALQIDDEIFFNSEYVRSKDDIIKNWVHENIHGQVFENLPNEAERDQALNNLYNSLGKDEIRRIVPREYWTQTNTSQANEYLSHAAEELTASGKLDESIPQEVKDIILGLANQFTTIKDIQDAKNIRTDLSNRKESGRNENVGSGNGREIQPDNNPDGREGNNTNASLRPSEGKGIDKSLPLADYLSRAKSIVQAKKAIPNTILINGVSRSTLNSNGKPIANSEEGIRNFYKWFGESATVNEKGQPIVFFHGSTEKFSEFNTDMAYFTPIENVAFSYGVNTIPAYLNIRKPLDLTDDILATKVINEINPDVFTDDEDVTNPIGTMLVVRYSELDFRDYALNNGFDGIILPTTKTVHSEKLSEKPAYIIFNPNQAKSATGNNGFFDPSDNNINFKVEDSPKPPLNDYLANAAEQYQEKKRTRRNLAEVKEKVREFIQDRDLPIRRLEELVKSMGGTIKDNMKPYRDMSLSYGRNETLYKNFSKDKMEPVIKTISKIIKSGVSGIEVLPYMISKHAIERNSYMRENEFKEWEENAKSELQQWVDSNTDIPQATKDRKIKEYNDEVQAKRNELANKDYSGVKGFDPEKRFDNPDELAQNIVDEFEDKVSVGLVDELWENVKEASNDIVNFWKAGQTMSAEQAETTKNRYKYFIPLRGWREGAAKQLAYKKGEGFASSLQRAKGRTSFAENPLAYLQQTAFKAIGEQVDNEVKASLLNLVTGNYDTEFQKYYHLKKAYYVKVELPDGSHEWEMTMERPSEEQFASGDAKTKIYEQYQKLRTPSQAHEHEVYIKRPNGDMIVVMSDEMLSVAQAMAHKNQMYRNLFTGNIKDIENWNKPLSNSIGVANNWLKGMYTAWNVVFPLTNFARDIQEASITQFIKGDSGHMVLANYKNAFPAIMRDLRGKTPTGKYGMLLQEFRAAGGNTGFTHLQTPEQLEKEINSRLNIINRKGTVRGYTTDQLRHVLSAIEAWNQIFEDATRFSVYITSRDNGKSMGDAAADAKEASVNFNRKGKSSKAFDSVWAFWNVAIQSMQKNFKLAKDHPGRFGIVASSWLALGFIEAMLNDMSGGDDDDKDYYNISAYVRENYLILPNIPALIAGDKSDKYLRIPLSQFWRGFKSAGSIAYDVYNGKMDALTASGKALSNFVGGLSPIDLGGFIQDGEFTIAPLWPTVLRPATDIASNRDYMGYKIAKEPFTQEQKMRLANSGLGKDNVNPAIKLCTDWLFRAGGGDNENKFYTKDGVIKQVPEYLDINPSVIEHLITGITGGTGRFVDDLFTTGMQIGDPEKEVDFKNAPFLNSFFKKIPEAKWKIIGEYYDMKSDGTESKFDALKTSYFNQKDKTKFKELAPSGYYNEYNTVLDAYDQKLTLQMKYMDYKTAEGSEEVTKTMKDAINAVKKIKQKYNR